MKQKLSVSVAVLVAAFVLAPIVHALPSSGSLVQGSSAAVYYVAADGKRYAFPNERIYRSWYANFSTVQRITDSQLADIPLGGVVHYRPGFRMVKITSDPKVYAEHTIHIDLIPSEVGRG